MLLIASGARNATVLIFYEITECQIIGSSNHSSRDMDARPAPTTTTTTVQPAANSTTTSRPMWHRYCTSRLLVQVGELPHTSKKQRREPSDIQKFYDVISTIASRIQITPACSSLKIERKLLLRNERIGLVGSI
jgi:hypothetical protein